MFYFKLNLIAYVLTIEVLPLIINFVMWFTECVSFESIECLNIGVKRVTHAYILKVHQTLWLQIVCVTEEEKDWL
jgi:hypothetical protein